MIPPLAPCIYQNRTDFTTVKPWIPALPWLRKVDACRWTRTVYGWDDSLSLHIPSVPSSVALFLLQHGMGRLFRLNICGEIAWEGLVYEITAELPGGTLTRTMTEMVNTVYTEYSEEETGANKATSP